MNDTSVLRTLVQCATFQVVSNPVPFVRTLTPLALANSISTTSSQQRWYSHPTEQKDG